MPLEKPPAEPDDGMTSPTAVDGLLFDALREELDASDLSDLRAFLKQVAADAQRSDPVARTRLAVLGPFRDLVEIARGGMGVVYRALDPKTGEEVAVKVPNPGLMALPTARRLFDKEAEAVGRLDHPAVVAHRPLEQAGSRFYIVSEYCNGPDLAAWLSKRGVPVPSREAARIIRDLAGAIAHAHARDVLHRDVKPSNILLPGSTKTSDAESLTPRLTDFGLAKLLDSAAVGEAATATGLIMGSPPYMAPEQASPGFRKKIGPWTDVYGLGAVLYELLTLRPPFRGDSPAETLGMVMTAEPVSIRTLRPNVPRALETIVLQCLEKTPERRYASAEGLREDLDAFLEGRRVKARRPGPLERLPVWAGKHPRAAALSVSFAAVVLILTAGVAAWTIALRRGRERSEQYAYVSRVQLAQRAADVGQLLRAQPILHGLIPRSGETDRREFAWRHLWNRTRREVRIIHGGDQDFYRLSVSPDGDRLAGGGEGMTLYDMTRDALIWHAPAPGGFVESDPWFSPDGSLVAFEILDSEENRRDRKRHLEVRRTNTGTLIGRRSISAGEKILCVGFSADGHLKVVLISLSTPPINSGRLCTWAGRNSLADVVPPLDFPTLYNTTVDGARSLVMDDAGRLRVVDAFRNTSVELLGASPAEIGPCQFSDDGRRVAMTYGRDARISIFDAETGRLLRRLSPIGKPIVAMTLQPGGEAIVVRTPEHEVRLIDESRNVDVCIYEPTSEIGIMTKYVRFTPDGNSFFVHRSETFASDHIEIRSTEDGSRLGESPGRFKALPYAWTIRPGGSPELLYSLGPYAWRWEWSRTIRPDSSDVLKAHNDETWDVVYSADGSLLATCSNNDYESATIRLRTPEGRLIREWEDADSTAVDLAFAPDASWIVTGHLARQQAVRVRPTRGDGEVVSVELPDGEWARAVGVAPDRPLIYIGGHHGTILAWDFERREVVWKIVHPPERRGTRNPERIHDLVISPDGRRLIISNDQGVVRCLDATNGRLLGSYSGRSPILALACNPEGNLVAAADMQGRILILDAFAANLNQVILGDDCDLRSLAFSPDGRTLAAAGIGRIVRLWEPTIGEELLSLPGHTAQVNALAFSPDGETLASADHSGIVRFWRAPQPRTSSPTRSAPSP